MSLPLTSLNLVAFSISSHNFLARLKSIDVAFDNDQVDGKGAAQRYDYNMNVKQGQKLDFTVMAEDLTGDPQPATNLSVAVWTIDGTDFLTSLRGGSLSVTTKTAEGSYISQLNHLPVAVGTGVEVSAETMEFGSAAIARTLAAGAVASFDAVVAITYGGEAFSAPMTIKGAVVKVDREQVTMQNVTLTLKGTPTSPATDPSSLLGTILLGTAAVAFLLDTGGDSWYSGGDQYAILTKLDVRFADANVVEQTGTLEVQGAMSAGATD